MRKKIVILSLALAVILPAVAFHVVTAQSPDPNVVSEADLDLTPEMERWVEDRKLEPGVHIGEFGSIRLVLVTDGERPTAGYSLDIARVDSTGPAWIVEVSRQEPGPDEMVAEVITYPYALVGFRDTQEKPIRVRDAETGQPWAPEAALGTDSGRLVGRIDAMSVEIRPTGVPAEIDPKVFRLTEETARQLEDLGIHDGDLLLFQYKENQHGQKVIVRILSKMAGPDADQETLTGVFTGRADHSSIEMALGKGEGNGLEVLRLEETIAKSFDDYGIDEGDTVTVRFVLNAWGQKVVTEIVGR